METKTSAAPLLPSIGLGIPSLHIENIARGLHYLHVLTVSAHAWIKACNYARAEEPLQTSYSCDSNTSIILNTMTYAGVELKIHHHDPPSH